MSYEIVAGGITPPMKLTATVDGVAVDLSLAETVTMLWELPDGTTREVELVGREVNDLGLGIAWRVWEAGDTGQVGTHRGQIRAVWPVDLLDYPEILPTDGSTAVWFVHPRIGD